MAYFPNGTSGMILDEQCDECLHGDQEAGATINGGPLRNLQASPLRRH